MDATASGRDGGRPLRVLLVDDHELLRRGVRQVIDDEQDMRVVAEAADGEEALERVRELRPDRLDLVLMDIEMPRLDGIAATRRIRAEDPDLPVVMLTVSSSDEDLFEAARAGSVGFLSKTLSPTALVRALRDFHRKGALPMPRTMAARLLAHLQKVAASERPAAGSEGAGAEHPESVLTPREREVLALIAQGCRDREIAQRLVLAQKTVKTHAQNILHKLGVRSRAAAVARIHRGAS